MDTENTALSPAPSDKPKLAASIYDWVETFCYAMALMVVLFLLVYRYVTVDGDSMRETLHDSDKLIISGLGYTPETGDIVVVKVPAYQNPIIKRVIATEGQEVEIDFENWTVKVDGVLLEEDYINRDVYGEFSLSGAVFLDSRSKADFSDGYSIVYAHHMENGAMFGDISKFVQADYFAAHPSGSLILPDAAYEIELFVCLEADAYDAEIYAVERYTADTAALLDAVQARAVQQRALDVGSQDRLIALSTCAGAETNGRVVLLGRLRPATLDEGDETQ